MSKPIVKQVYFSLLLLLYGAIVANTASAKFLTQPSVQHVASNNMNALSDNSNNYIANNNSVQQLLYVIGEAINKPIIVSPEAAKKRVSGTFELNHPQTLLDTVASRTGLVWYDDGTSVYVYDATELQSRVVELSYAPFDRLVAYLRSSGLYDERFPVRSDGNSGSFYVSGPPVYVELVTAAAKYIDRNFARPGTGTSTIRVIKLKHSFVNDRSYTQRDKPVIIPGVATVLNQLLNNGSGGGSASAPAGANITIDNDTRHALEVASASQSGDFPALPAFGKTSAAPAATPNAQPYDAGDQAVNIVAYSDTNSLLVHGSARQVSYVEDLVKAIDIAKEQIQLSLWIIDISKDDIDELGIRWQGAALMGSNGVTFNTSTLTPTTSLHFLADVSALAQKGNAQIVSRPELLAQENIPALFDNNSSFYAKVIGERTASLEKITYGTMISVLPRLAQHQNEIEMILNIQDGGLPLDSNGQTQDVESLPVVNNTQISTEARVPAGYSLLVGGYSRDQNENHDIGIPGLRSIPLVGRLFDYSYVSHKKMVRIFLIQPKLLDNGHTWQGQQESNPVLGRSSQGHDVTLQSTVSMLRHLDK
ncbi:type III secretion system outer membrane ring subunit SctC [Pantoea agglomerans]|uniref:type III secretion system outer membrane ring subunit SctC n=1 Tax=Enterobacter agglomerans TaxID=549 RepID=UPI0013B73AEE|nr:type III secretion system outer membrane ring subunit SctC [Pantoea agglomerans]NEG59861.1 EscC/YscC/HrcC family type III secretion system outer membrane ring protein [Pantoea agglomerans]NEG98830.1 EscC/YscC/HrcC family type III secretion system outer membrane ring protein [Pantoea agglomerans]NEH05186.1 EscC/YscC/HrcC family type III secretion system outer membrane ring protein [Pantoea agglomerans]NEH16175.1 EscC/YscC/HrcC family type III secretion system outer membrane ring protein [Pant